MLNGKIIEALNKDVANEMAAIIQYLHHHYTAEGMAPAVIEQFEKASRDEMRHMEMLSERITYLGGEPTTVPSPIRRGGDLRKMIMDDLATENEAIKLYKEHVKLAAELDDPTTRLMLEHILSDEEKHADTWETDLGIKSKKK